MRTKAILKASHPRFGHYRATATKPAVLLLSAVLCIGLLSSCGDGDRTSNSRLGGASLGSGSGLTTQSQVTTEEISTWIQQGAKEWLSGFTGSPPLSCPNTPALMIASDSSVQACAFEGDDGGFYVRIKNRSPVPVSVWGRPGVDPVKTILPQGTIALLLSNPQYGQYLSYKANSVAGLTSAVVGQVQEELNEQRAPGYKWVGCAVTPTAECLVTNLASILPRVVVFRGFRIPVRRLASGLALAYQNRALLDAFAGEAIDRPPSTIRIVQAG